MAAAGGQVPAVHHIGIAHHLSRQTGVLVAGGKLRGQVDMDHRIPLGRQGAEQLLVFAHGDGGGFGKGTGGRGVVVNVLGLDVYPIPAEVVPQADTQGNGLGAVGFVKRGGQVAGRVAGDADV